MQKLSEIPNLDWIQQNYPKVKAIFFDMDGTLFPTEEHHARALAALLAELNIQVQWEELFEKYAGLSDEQVFQRLGLELPVEELLKRKNSYFKEIVNTQKLLPRSLKSLLDDIKNSTLQLALVTSSEKEIAHYLLDLEEVTHLFPLIITREDTPENKPHPMPYLEAMKYFDLDAKDALIFEDSVSGLAAAAASEANVIQVQWF